MQQLHLVGFTTDIEGLIFSTRRGSRSGGYMVVLDDRLLDRIEDALRLRREQDSDSADSGESRRPLRAAANGKPSGRPKPSSPAEGGPGEVPLRPGSSPAGGSNGDGHVHQESVLSVREIQARLRAGFSITEVAAEAGVDEDWVGRFAVPILAEQEQVIERAQQLVYVAPRKGDSSLPLGLAVQMSARDRGIALDDDRFGDSWTAYQLHDSRWVVRFTYVSRKRIQHADWEIDTRAGTLTALNRVASELGFVEKGRRRAGLTVDDSVVSVAGATPAASGSIAATTPERARSRPVKRSAKTAKTRDSIMTAKAAKTAKTAKKRDSKPTEKRSTKRTTKRSPSRSAAVAKRSTPSRTSSPPAAEPAVAAAAKRSRPATNKRVPSNDGTGSRAPRRTRRVSSPPVGSGPNSPASAPAKATAAGRTRRTAVRRAQKSVQSGSKAQPKATTNAKPAAEAAAGRNEAAAAKPAASKRVARTAPPAKVAGPARRSAAGTKAVRAVRAKAAPPRPTR